jgi:uncharacterized protein YutE (UPF0331/DUF86 family)
MHEAIAARFDELLASGAELARVMPRQGGSFQMVAPTHREPEYHAWLTSSANLVQAIAPKGSYFLQECDQVLHDKDLIYRVPTRLVLRMLGILQSAKAEFDKGLLRRVEYLVAAATFDDFLDHAATYHKGNMKNEAAVLASAVLEDVIKKIAAKNELPVANQSIEELMDSLVKSAIFTDTKAKRVRAYAGVRNHALHAEWEEFDIKDVGEQIAGVRDLIAEFL